MKRLKEKILEDNQLPTPSPTDRSTPSTSSTTPPTSSSTGDLTPPTPSHTTRSNDTYVYGVGIVAVLAIGVCVFFGYNAFQPKTLINEKKINHLRDVIYFKNIYNKWLVLTGKYFLKILSRKDYS